MKHMKRKYKPYNAGDYKNDCFQGLANLTPTDIHSHHA